MRGHDERSPVAGVLKEFEAWVTTGDEMHVIRIDRSKRLLEERHLGHNRYHPDIEPILEVEPGEEVVLETRDGVDGQLPPSATVAPSAAELEAWTGREQRLLERGGLVFPPDPAGAVPGGGCGLRGLRTLPPRENGGNFDVKQLTKGSKLLLPVFTEGALFSTGDGHFAQGDGEVCVTAVEIGATVAVRFSVHKGLAAARKFTAPVFRHDGYFADPKFALPSRMLGVMGMPIQDDGENDGENLTLACRNAVRNMIELLQERGFSREQAYVICSVAVDLRIGNVVDVPNYVATALVSEAIFD